VILRRALFLISLSLPLIAQTSAPAPTLTLPQAEQLALRNNPSVSVARLTALVQGEVTREVRSVELPNVSGNITAVDSHVGSRIAAGGLNNSIVYPRSAGGLTISQLFTDFGRTRNLVASAKWQQQAAQDQQRATAAEITYAVDEAYFRTLNTQELVKVAQQTVDTRQNTAYQISALADSKLKSDLDRSFSQVNLQQAKLQLLEAQNAADASLAFLNTLLGNERTTPYQLTYQSQAELALPPQDENALVEAAFRSRPDLIALNEQYEAEQKNDKAEHELYRPSISGLAAYGGSPVRADQITPWYGAAGVNMNIPIFNGFLFNARAHAADYRTQQAKEQVRDLRNRIARDVRVTMLNAQSSYQRVQVSEQLLKQANLALDLAQTRYKLGLSSIVELSQAQLQQAQAAIGDANAKYDYQAALAALRFQTGQ
jgi:outer membrane protein